jgi:hypothetical protein
MFLGGARAGKLDDVMLQVLGGGISLKALDRNQGMELHEVPVK